MVVAERPAYSRAIFKITWTPLLLLLLVPQPSLLVQVASYVLPATTPHSCYVFNHTADCRHRQLSHVPDNLPTDLTSLLLEHNRLHSLQSHLLARYPALRYLEAGYNSISQISPNDNPCAVLPNLAVLSIPHNQLGKLHSGVFASCSELTELDLSFNTLQRTSAEENIFATLTNLTVLNITHNHLSTVKIGTFKQLPELRYLNYSNNVIHTLRDQDFVFVQNVSLYAIDLSRNPLQTFADGCFKHVLFDLLVLDSTALGSPATKLTSLCQQLQGAPLKALSLRNVQLRSVKSQSFRYLSSCPLLARLDLSHNGLTAIDDDAFTGLQNLEELVLEGNNLLKISGNTFRGLSALKYLHMANSSRSLGAIGKDTLSSLSQSPLLYLNLSRSGITKISKGAFQSTPLLQRLDLGMNKLNQRLMGNEFAGLSAVLDIYMSYNTYVMLTSGSFANTPSLRRLWLSRTRLTSLDSERSPFYGLVNLTYLDLSNNNMNKVLGDTFRGLAALQTLKLGHNNLARLWKHNNPPVLYLDGLRQLRSLELLFNGFDEVPAAAFAGLSNLRSLDMNSNNMDKFPPGVFNPLTSLASLDLRRNLITGVQEEVFGEVFGHLDDLWLGTRNPFDCTCDSLGWFANWLRNATGSPGHGHVHVPGADTEYVCRTPPSYFNTSVLAFDTLACKDHAPFFVMYVVSQSALLSVVVVALFVHFQGWRLEYFASVLVHRVLGYESLPSVSGGEEEGQEEGAARRAQYSYDVFVICSSEDEHWTSRHLEPLEEDGMKLWLEERDLLGGEVRAEAYSTCMHQSRRVLVVVTRALFRDTYYRKFAVAQAQKRAIEQNRDDVVLALLEDIPEFELHHKLCLRAAMFPRRCVLRWPQDPTRLPLFLQQLRVALGSA
ncbi:toll-like receptor 3 [Petromyzon marinus]|uniref:toll-like receptor 3 n=1 Tax=Petromyzon marinus TaxID=7757 RepID=UPI003F70C8E2